MGGIQVVLIENVVLEIDILVSLQVSAFCSQCFWYSRVHCRTRPSRALHHCMSGSKLSATETAVVRDRHLHFPNVFLDNITLVHKEMLKNKALVENTRQIRMNFDFADSETWTAGLV